MDTEFYLGVVKGFVIKQWLHNLVVIAKKRLNQTLMSQKRIKTATSHFNSHFCFLQGQTSSELDTK